MPEKPIKTRLMQLQLKKFKNKKHRRHLQLQKQNATVIFMQMKMRSNVATNTAVMDLVVENYFFV